MKWKSKKAAQKLKHRVEKTYEVEVICLSIRRERQRFIFVLCHVGRTASNIQRSTSCIEHVQILTQSLFTTIERTMKEFGVSNHLVEKPSMNKEKGVLREYSRIFSPCLPRTPPFSFTTRNYSTVFIFFIEFTMFLLQIIVT